MAVLAADVIKDASYYFLQSFRFHDVHSCLKPLMSGAVVTVGGSLSSSSFLSAGICFVCYSTFLMP